MNLKGKIAFITGASAGIGKACAEKFAEAGANLVLLARRKENIDELALELNGKFGTESITFRCDVRNYSEVEEAVNKLPEEWRAIEVLVNNAGLARGLNKLHEGDLENWEEMIDTNIKGLLYVSRLVIPLMAERKSGTVINIGSLAGREVYPNGNVYCGTKHAVKAISKGMTIDLNGTGVRVCNLDPGLVETEFSIVRFRGDAEKAEKVYQNYTPLYAEDIADIALFTATRPAHVMIQDILVTPTAQASSTIIDKG
jgi:3-hydroxy acid dehydrogenase/malonic semialdehyde reductase